MVLNQEDIKNLVGWLQAIYKESQATRGELHEIRAKVNLLPEIRESSQHSKQDSGDAERKIEEARNYLDNRLHKIEDTLNELRSHIRDLQAKIDRIK